EFRRVLFRSIEGVNSMRRFSTFIFGMATGGVLVYLALYYHLIQAKDGLHLVPKTESKLAATYIDVRNFTPADCAKHGDVALALMQADRTDLLQSASSDLSWSGVDQRLPPASQAR